MFFNKKLEMIPTSSKFKNGYLYLCYIATHNLTVKQRTGDVEQYGRLNLPMNAIQQTKHKLLAQRKHFEDQIFFQEQ